MSETLSPETPAGAKKPYIRPRGELGKEIASRISKLQKGYLSDHPAARRDVAELRRALSRDPGEEPAVWLLTQVDTLPGIGDAPTPREWAAYLAMCLYALHQQGRSVPVHVPGATLGRAVAQAAGDQREESSLWTYFTSAVTATDIRVIRQHLTVVISQLRRNDFLVALDYAALADDLVALQDPYKRNQTRLRWQRDFYNNLTEEPATPAVAEQN